MNRLLPLTLLTIALAGTASTETTAAPPARYGFACDHEPSDSTASADDRVTPEYLRLRKQVCSDAGLRSLDRQLAALSVRITAETAGVDGETGRAIDHYGDEHMAWRRQTLAACSDRACMATAYRARLADVRVRWRDALE